MPTRTQTASRSAVRTSPLLSDEDRQFLAGDLSADCFLETARRRAADQTRRELARYTCTATLATLITVAFITVGTGLFRLPTTAVLAGTATSLGGLAAILGPLAHHHRRQTRTPK
ncbi:hypothetical protein Prum_068160 [Phytohabitans rumicis]|uniref:Uncharacterized protein n=1 Tax=Phytohabitans rumicis TaxID=1076125 RepID=A0A6V8LA07_9ACTN|nr:hypothetical protein Prum_068160 [Phytohabitans rumicis]